MKKISQLQGKLKGKTVLVRVDYNVAFKNGKILEMERIQRSLLTIQFLRNQGARVLLVTHLGRPLGKRNATLSLTQLLPALKKLFPIQFIYEVGTTKSQQAIKNLKSGEVGLFENIRFFADEEKNGARLIKLLSEVANIYVNDAFSVSHRKHASVYGIAQKLPAYAGFNLMLEIEGMSHATKNITRPSVAVIGGVKVSTKFKVLRKFCKTFDKVLIGGALANTFLRAQGLDTGVSYVEKKYIPQAKKLLKEYSKKIILPLDGVGTGEKKRWNMFDIGPQTRQLFISHINQADTIVWNGPLGKFEDTRFNKGSYAVAKALAKHSLGHAFGIVGGGETLAIISNLKIHNSFDFVSTGGGAMLEYIELGTLPGIQVLR